MIADDQPKAVAPTGETEKQGSNIMEIPKEEPTKEVKITAYQAMLVDQWQKTHGNERAPIYLNEKGEPVWLNRKERAIRDSIYLRKQRKLLKSAQRELAAPTFSDLIPNDLKEIYLKGFVGIRGFEFYPTKKE